MLQMNSGVDVDENLASAEYWLQQACNQHGAEALHNALLVLPENFATMGGSAETRYHLAERDGEGAIQEWLTKIATQYRCYVASGTLPLKLPNQPAPKVAASCLVMNPNGERIARYDKRHLFDVTLTANESYRESDRFIAGNEVVAVNIEGTSVGLSVCYDLRFPEHYRQMQPMPDVWLVPSAFTYTTGQQHWQTLLRARAIENQSHVVGVNQCGQHADKRQTWGHSEAFNASGDSLARLGQRPAIAMVNLELPAQQIARTEFPVLQHRRA